MVEWKYKRAGVKTDMKFQFGRRKFTGQWQWLIVHVRWFRIWLKPARHKALLLVTAAVMAVTQIIPFLEPHVEAQRYNLDNVNHLLPRQSEQLAQKLQLDGTKQEYVFNKDYSPATISDSGGASKNGGSKIKATAGIDASKGVTVTDVVNNVDFTLTPKFDLLPAKQDSNRVYYPLADNTGWLVYTMQADQVAEDLVLTRAKSDTMQIKYDLGLGDKFAAKIGKDGSVGIFGSSLPISGQVSTGSDADAALLAKARKNATKDKLLFTLPAPVIRQSSAGETNVKAKFTLQGSELILDVTGLKTGNYPIDIDPSVYVQSAQGLMYGNNETNINFDTTNNLFQKTTVSGGNIRDGVTQDSWLPTTALPVALMGHATAISGGYIYVVGGTTTGATTAAINRVYWAKLNVSSTTAIGSWTTNTGYNLPINVTRHSLVAYNDFLYVIGGNTGSAVSGNIYSLHLAASGEPTPNWVTVANSLPVNAGDQLHSAVAYLNRLYIFGGQAAAGGNTGTVNSYVTNINPDGTLGAWSTITNLPQALWGTSAAIYNGFAYVVGGSVGATSQAKIYYAPITATGVGAWQTNGSDFSGARSAIGGNFMTIWAGYMYLAGGCGAATATSYCNAAPLTDVQQASINADGSITSWTGLQAYNTGTSAFAAISQQRSGYGLVSFGTANDPSAANAGGTLYAIGGCTTTQASGTCTTISTTTNADISSEGDLGPAQTTTALDTNAGFHSAAVVANNGFIYNIGGCRTFSGCDTASNTIYYAQLNSNGTLGTWLKTGANLPATRTAPGATVLNNTLYVGGGGTGSGAPTRTIYSAPISANGDIPTGTTWGNNTTGIVTGGALYPYMFSYANPATPSQGYIYIVGGCVGTAGVGCSSYVDDVWRCVVTAPGAAASSCAQSGLQLPTATGIAAGSVYGNYVYLSSGANASASGTAGPAAGGAAGSYGGQTNLTYYAKIDSTGTIVLPPGKTGTYTGLTGAFWPTVTGKLANNGVPYAAGSTNKAPGQRRRAAGYVVNGYMYVLGGHDANTSVTNGSTLQDMEIGKIDPTTGDIESFVDNYYQITPRWDFKGIAANGFIYAVGGCSTGFPPGNCTAADRAVQYMQVYNNYSGTPASYTASTNTGTPVIGASSAVSNGKIYVAGGATAFGGTPTAAVQYANINADGSAGAWTTIAGGSSGAMGTARMYHNLIANNGYLYALGGQSGTATSTALATTERSLIDPSTGIPGAFTADTTLGGARSGMDAVSYNGYVYVSGGINAAGTYTNTVQYSQFNASNGVLGAWTASGNTFVAARMFHTSVAYNGTLYIMGGFDGTNYLGDVQYAQINANGSISAFTPTQNLPQPVSQGSSFAANGYVYVVGGRSGNLVTSCTNNTYVASVSANSTVAAGNVPNGLGNWTQTAVSFAGTRYGGTATYSAGKAYLFGGSQCATNTIVTAATNANYGTLQSQPQVAQYSYAIDAVNDVFPSKSLFNGIDNGIGANWTLDYRSSTDAAKVWGLNTSYGKTTLGTPQNYTPYNAAGANTNFARYYWLSLSIDGSQAFGYPEDVSRGPTIANLTLQFTANPSQRLRNGKTFINNVEQPLDAPF